MGAGRGVVTLANDTTVDWLIALCESLRQREPEMPLTVIPYDDRVDRVRGLAAKYRFTLMDDPSLRALDELGRRLVRIPGQAPMFRKLAAFWGPYDPFVYTDADCVVGAPLALLFDGFERSGADFIPLNFAEPSDVYRPGPLFDEAAANPARGFNAGGFVARREALGLERLLEIGAEAEPAREQFADTGDQPFTNFCVERAGLRVATVEDAIPEVAPATWGGLPFAEFDGMVRAADPTWPTYRLPAPILHWAGFRPVAGLPLAGLWLKYRLRGEPPARRATFRVLRWWLPGLAYTVARALRNVQRRLSRQRRLPNNR